MRKCCDCEYCYEETVYRCKATAAGRMSQMNKEDVEKNNCCKLFVPVSTDEQLEGQMSLEDCFDIH